MPKSLELRPLPWWMQEGQQLTSWLQIFSRVKHRNADEWNQKLIEKLNLQQCSHENIEELLVTFPGGWKRGAGTRYQRARSDSCRLTFGLYVHGNTIGTTRESRQYLKPCQYVNQ